MSKRPAMTIEDLAQLIRERLPSPALLLTKAEAARRMGVDRATTLAQLINSGQLRTVAVGSRVRIPLAEIERIAREGTAPVASVRRPAHRYDAKAEAEAIRRLKI